MEADRLKTLRNRSAWRSVVVVVLGGILSTPPVTWADEAPAVARGEEMLAKAREDLRISEATVERIKTRFIEHLIDSRAAGASSLPSSAIYDYAIYLDRVQAMADVQLHAVRELDALLAEHGVPEPGDRTGDPLDVDDAVRGQRFEPEMPRNTSALGRLDRELDASLADFDAFLLEEQYEAQRRLERIEAVSDEEMTDLAREAAAAVERLRDQGIDIETGTPSEGSGQPGEQGRPGQQGGQPGQPGEQGGQPGQPGQGGQPGGAAGGGAGGEGEAGDGKGGPLSGPGGAPGEGDGEGAGDGTGEGAEGEPGGATGEGEGEGGGQPGGQAGGGQGSGGSGSGEGATGSGGATEGTGTGTGGGTGADDETPRDVPSGEDDDIVARQLREAAERETDPELKARLWREYERYKGLPPGTMDGSREDDT